MDLDQAQQNKLSCNLSCVNLHTLYSEKQLSCHIFWCKLTHILTVKTAQLPRLWAFTLCFLVSSAANLSKQLGPRSGPTKCRAWSGSNMFDTQMVFLKEFFKNKCFWKNPQTTKRHAKLPPRGKSCWLTLILTGHARIRYLSYTHAWSHP